jgi:hypothetical protein
MACCVSLRWCRSGSVGSEFWSALARSVAASWIASAVVTVGISVACGMKCTVPAMRVAWVLVM